MYNFSVIIRTKNIHPFVKLCASSSQRSLDFIIRDANQNCVDFSIGLNINAVQNFICCYIQPDKL